MKPKDEYIILCQDDHLFTKEYSKEYLLYCINEAQSLHADILSCGVSGFTAAIQISQHVFWVENFSGLQFAVIFRKFFQKILDANFETLNAADLKFLSIQKEFGYSDVTDGNNEKGLVERAFRDTDEKVKVINIHEKTEHLRNIEKQFAGKEEFNVTIIEACHHKVKESGLWLSIKKIIETTIENDDDVIIICQEDHQFTEHYERNHFMKLIWQAGFLGCNVLIGGMGVFNLALPIIDGIFWIDSFKSSKFFVIYRTFFKSILQEPFCDSDTVESKFSEMTSSKMALYPFISVQKDFSLSNKIYNGNKIKTINTNLFAESSRRLGAFQNAYLKYQLHKDIC